MARYFIYGAFIFISIVIYNNLGESFAQVAPMVKDGKPGSCPPPLPRMICSDICRDDMDCPGAEKCCRTNCGGSICSRSVTARANVTLVKAGTCPPINEGPWFCTSTCISDSDCRGRKKCCKNKCGAHGCKFPVMDTIPKAMNP